MLRCHAPGELDALLVELFAELVGARLGDDERRARFVDQHAVGLVDDRQVQPAQQRRGLALGAVELAQPQVIGERVAGGDAVLQVVEYELLVGDVDDVAGVLRAALRQRHVLLDHADAHAHELVERAVVLGVARGEVIVDGDDMYRCSGSRGGAGSEGGDERLSLAGRHLRDPALQQRPAADELHVVGPHADAAHRRLAHGGERLRHRRVREALALHLQALRAEAGRQRGVAKALHCALVRHRRAREGAPAPGERHQARRACDERAQMLL